MSDLFLTIYAPTGAAVYVEQDGYQVCNCKPDGLMNVLLCKDKGLVVRIRRADIDPYELKREAGELKGLVRAHMTYGTTEFFNTVRKVSDD